MSQGSSDLSSASFTKAADTLHNLEKQQQTDGSIQKRGETVVAPSAASSQGPLTPMAVPSLASGSGVGLQRVLLLQALAQRQREILAISTQLVAESAATSPPPSHGSQFQMHEGQRSDLLGLGTPSEQLHHSISNSSSIYTLQGQLALLPESEREAYAKLMSTNWSSVLDAMNSKSKNRIGSPFASGLSGTTPFLPSGTPLSSTEQSSEETESPDLRPKTSSRSPPALQYAFNAAANSNGIDVSPSTPTNASQLLLAQQQLDAWTKTVFSGSYINSPSTSSPTAHEEIMDSIFSATAHVSAQSQEHPFHQSQPHHPADLSTASSAIDWTTFFSSPPFSGALNAPAFSAAAYDLRVQSRDSPTSSSSLNGIPSISSHSTLSSYPLSVAAQPVFDHPPLGSSWSPSSDLVGHMENLVRPSSSQQAYGASPGKAKEKDLKWKGKSNSASADGSNTSTPTTSVKVENALENSSEVNWEDGVEKSNPDEIEEDRRRRNTEASARFRAKKKQRDAALQLTSSQLRGRILELEQVKGGLQKENKWLKDLIKEKGEVDKLIAEASADMTENRMEKSDNPNHSDEDSKIDISKIE